MDIKTGVVASQMRLGGVEKAPFIYGLWHIYINAP